MECITHKILDWTEEKYDDVRYNPDEKHPYAKAFVYGAIEGAIDGFVMLGLYYFGVGIVKGIKKRFKK